MILSGSLVQVTGTGSVNGTNVKWTLSAEDGQSTGGSGVDKFRMQIWNSSTNVPLYDNMPAVTSGAMLSADMQPTDSSSSQSILRFH
jgi:hypothetical protein